MAASQTIAARERGRRITRSTPGRMRDMTQRNIHITDRDMRRLRALLLGTADPLGKGPPLPRFPAR